MTIHSFPFICNYLLCKHKPCAFYVWLNLECYDVIWPSGAVVKVLAYHAGGREFEPPLEQFFFFFFFFFEKRFFFILFSHSNLFFFALIYFSFSYLHNLIFFLFVCFVFFFFYFFFQIDLHVISFSNLYKLNNLLISQLLILSMNYC